MTQGVVQALFGMMREAMGFQLTNFQDCFSPAFRFIFGCLMKTCSTRDSVSFTAEEMTSVERNRYSVVDAEVFKKLKTFRLTSRGLSCKANRPRQQALAELVVEDCDALCARWLGHRTSLSCLQCSNNRAPQCGTER
jgi:hypothetical protein